MRYIVRVATAGALALAPMLVMAQTREAVPDQTIGEAGAALHDVAKLQKKYQAKMESASPEQKSGLSEQANAEAVQAIQSHGISVQEYSSVVHTAQNNPEVRQRLLEAARKGD
jgi:F0F1-type ATP synthase membrane subunit b/b'